MLPLLLETFLFQLTFCCTHSCLCRIFPWVVSKLSSMKRPIVWIFQAFSLFRLISENQISRSITVLLTANCMCWCIHVLMLYQHKLQQAWWKKTIDNWYHMGSWWLLIVCCCFSLSAVMVVGTIGCVYIWPPPLIFSLDFPEGFHFSQ